MLVIDTGIANSGSLLNMLYKLGVNAGLASTPSQIESAHKIIFPGVGAFDSAMDYMLKSNLLPALKQRIIDNKVPFLGICLGMQLLFDTSEEGKLPGFGWIPGQVKRFDFLEYDNTHYKIPHMGWNQVRPTKTDSLFKGLEQDCRFYFVHSYHAVCSDSKHILGLTEYGYPFVSAVQKDNIFGVQFHPEKSHRFGMTLLKNFAEISKC